MSFHPAEIHACEDKYEEILKRIIPFSFSVEVGSIAPSLPEALRALDRVVDTPSVKIRMKAVATIGNALGKLLELYNSQEKYEVLPPLLSFD